MNPILILKLQTRFTLRIFSVLKIMPSVHCARGLMEIAVFLKGTSQDSREKAHAMQLAELLLHPGQQGGWQLTPSSFHSHITVLVSPQLPQQKPIDSQQEAEEGEVLQSRISSEANTSRDKETSTPAVLQLIQEVQQQHDTDQVWGQGHSLRMDWWKFQLEMWGQREGDKASYGI